MRQLLFYNSMYRNSLVFQCFFHFCFVVVVFSFYSFYFEFVVGEGLVLLRYFKISYRDEETSITAR